MNEVWQKFVDRLDKVGIDSALVAQIGQLYGQDLGRIAEMSPEDLREQVTAPNKGPEVLTSEQARQIRQIARQVLEPHAATTLVISGPAIDKQPSVKAGGKDASLFTIEGQLTDARTREPLVGYYVRAFDVDRLDEDDFLGEGKSNKQGRFRVRFREEQFTKGVEETFSEGGPDIQLKVFDQDKNFILATEPRSDASRLEEYMISIREPRLRSVPLEKVARKAGLSDSAVRSLQSAGLQRAEDIFTPQGRKVIAALNLDGSHLRRFQALAHYAFASGELTMASRLVDAGYQSPSGLARVPLTRVKKQLEQRGGPLSPDEQRTLGDTHRYSIMTRTQTLSARIANASLDPILHANTALPAEDLADDDQADCPECEYRDSVFGPLAYVYDLVAFIEANWSIRPDRLEEIILQDINIKPEDALEPIAQIQLAIGVLERLLKQELGVDFTRKAWTAAYRELVRAVFGQLGLDPEDPNPDPEDEALYESARLNNPYLEDINRMLEEALGHRRRAGNGSSGNDGSMEEQAAAIAEHRRRQAEGERQLDAAAAPDTTLSTYRQLLLEAAAAELRIDTDLGIEAAADVLENSLFIDLQGAPCQLTTRVTQIIQSLQSFILSIRVGDITEAKRGGRLSDLLNKLGSADFDEASWRWLRTYASWNAAMYSLVFPENMLSPPTQRRLMTNFFRNVVARLASGRATQELADQVDEEYRVYFRGFRHFRVINAHLVGNRLFVFARAGEVGDYSLWLNVIKQDSLYTQPAPGAGVTEAQIHSSDWFDVHSWPTELKPQRVLPYTNGSQIRFLVLGQDGSSTWKSFKLKDDGVLDGEAEFEAEIAATDESAESGEKPDSIVLGTAGRLSHTPVLIADATALPGRYRSVFDESTEEWGPWLFWNSDQEAWDPQTKSLVGRNECRIQRNDDDSATLIVEGSRAMQVSLSFRSGGGEIPYRSGDLAILAWNREESSYDTTLVLSKSNGDMFVRWTPLAQNYLELGRMRQVYDRLNAYADFDTWPSILQDMASLPARHMAVVERYLYFPLLAGWALSQAGDYVSAHDWYRHLYDPFAENKEVFPFSDYFHGEFTRPEDWLADVTDPDAIARQRAGAYLRHSLLMMAKNVLDWADHEFALNNPESRNRARELYLLARRVLQAPAIKRVCEEGLKQITFEVVNRFSENGLAPVQTLEELVAEALEKLTGVHRQQSRDAAYKQIRDLLEQDLSLAAFLNKLEEIVQQALAQDRALSPGFLNLYGPSLHSGNDRDMPAVNGRDPDRGLPGGPPAPGAQLGEAIAAAFCVPANPLIEAYRLRADTGLFLLRHCLDINGDPQPEQLVPLGSLKNRIITTFGVLAAQERAFYEMPPRYRYSFLVEKARQHAALAQQLAAAMLSAIEKRDNAALAQLQAEIAGEVAGATVDLKKLVYQEADRGVTIAGIQLGRASLERDFWRERVSYGLLSPYGLNAWEMGGLALMGASGMLQLAAALGSFVLMGPETHLSMAGASESQYVGAGRILNAGGVAAGKNLVSTLQSLAGAASTFGNLSLTMAGFLRRWEDWQHQNNLARIGFQLANEQLLAAQDRRDITEREVAIAEMQQGHSDLVIEFYKNRFSNEILYQWMIGMLREAYRGVMQSATATAQQAQQALAFERQQAVTVIQGDYWTIEEPTLSDEQRASGLLGAERLQADLAHLDEWKVRTDRRRLQLSKTISLARMLPRDFVEFQKTGRIELNTLRDWFDRDFPGHYLRLIKSVKVTVIALVPPTEGIHAMLSNNGYSNVVVEDAGGRFVTVDGMRRFPETVALDNPFGDTGLFVLDYNDPMLLPFEGLGVETGWVFEMPRGTNRFNYDTLVDVLFTIDYTALYDGSYRMQVLERLGDRQDGEVAVSLRVNFADAWYHLKNPTDAAQDQVLIINLAKNLFPETSNLGVRHLTVVLAGEAGKQTNGDLAPYIQKAGIFSNFAAGTGPNGTEEDGMFAVKTDELGAYSTRNAVPVTNDVPLTPFAVDPGNSHALLSPDVDHESKTLLDPVGDWEIRFKPSWFTGAHGSRKIDDIDDIVLILSVEYDVEWAKESSRKRMMNQAP